MELKPMKKILNLHLIHKIIFIFLAAFIIAMGIELIYNYPALRYGYGEIDITEAGTFDDDEFICEYTFDSPVYINKLRVKGDFEKDLLYTITVYKTNGFGKEEVTDILDQCYKVFDEAYSNINSFVDKIVLKIENAEDNVNIQQITINNRFSVNKYRLLFYGITVSLVLLIIFFRQLTTKYLEYLFVFFALGYGLIMILMVGPRNVTWDEHIHFKNIYCLVSDDTVDWNKSAWMNYQQQIPDPNTKEELYMLKQYLNENAEIEYHSNPNTVEFSTIAMRAYTPMAIFYKIGDLLELPYSVTFMLGKIGNLLFYTFIVWAALHLASSRKILIFSLAVLPTVLFQGSMYSYDGMVNALILLGVVLIMNEFADTGKIKPLRTGGIILLLVAGSYSKAIYIPLVLILLAYPGNKFESKKQEYLFKGLVVAVFLMVMATFVLPVISNTVEGNLLYSDARGGDTSTFGQLKSILFHPVASIKLFLSSIFSFDNFRNLGYATADNYLATNLMFLNFASLGSLADKWSFLLIPLLFLLLFIPNEKVKRLSKTMRIWYALIILGVIVLIWMALYLSFTPVGSDYIDGVQVRYYFPLLLPISYLTWTNSWRCRVRPSKYNGIVIAINGILMFECIYQLMLQVRCL